MNRYERNPTAMSGTIQLESLRDHLQQLADRQAITDLVTRLALMLDDKRYDQAPTIFTDDVRVRTAAGSALGPAAAVEHARRNHTVRTQHAICGVLIDLHGDRSTAHANFINTFVPDSDQPGAQLVIGNTVQPQSRLMLGERYHFEAVRTDSGWRLSSIEVTRVWSSDAVPAGSVVRQATGEAA
jgi:hypothetical protein